MLVLMVHGIMNEYGLRIFEAKHNVVSIGLLEILDLISIKAQLNWAFLFLDAIGSLRETYSLASLTLQIKESKNGFYINLDEIYELFPKLDQIIDLDLIGSRVKSKLQRYETDKEIYESCEIVIRMVDSSYWEIYFHDKILFEKFEKQFAKTEWINMKALKDLN